MMPIKNLIFRSCVSFKKLMKGLRDPETYNMERHLGYTEPEIKIQFDVLYYIRRDT